MSQLFDLHDTDWPRFSRSPVAGARLRDWASRQEALRNLDTLDHVLAALADRGDPDAQDRLLHALLAEARSDHAARRTVFRAITPGLVAIVRSYKDRWGEADASSMVALAAFERIASYPLLRTRAVAANLLHDIRHDLYEARAREVRHDEAIRTAPLRESHLLSHDEPDAGTEVLDIVGQAVEDGIVTRRAGRLIVLYHVFDVIGPSLADRDGANYEATKKYRRRAEAALIGAASEVA